MKSKHYLKKDQEFTHVYKKRKTYGNRNFTLYCRKNDLPYTRVGFSISKKVGKAVVRNRCKRRMRAIYEGRIDEIKSGYDLVFVIKPLCALSSYEELESAFLHILRVSRLGKRQG